MSKIEAFWENATADDVARVMAGETVEARFRDEAYQDWACGFYSLCGWAKNHSFPWKSSEQVHKTFGCWKQCQVYREPAWYANKPDPGPGFRLLEKFPGEALQVGDEVFQLGGWRPSVNHSYAQGQSPENWYRRRIEPVEPKFAVGQMVKVIEPKATDAKHWDSEMARHVGTLQTIKYIEGFANPPEIFYGLYGLDSRKFREDYLEAVEPEPQHYVLRVGDSCETPSGNRTVVMPQGRTQRFVNAKAGDTIKTIHGQTITITEKGFEVTQ